jgi:hypothetical protein
MGVNIMAMRDVGYYWVHYTGGGLGTGIGMGWWDGSTWSLTLSDQFTTVGGIADSFVDKVYMPMLKYSDPDPLSKSYRWVKPRNLDWILASPRSNDTWRGIRKGVGGETGEWRTSDLEALGEWITQPSGN